MLLFRLKNLRELNEMIHRHAKKSEREERKTSNRSFGFLMFFFFMTTAFFPRIQGKSIHLFFLGIGVFFLLLTAFKINALLTPLNRLWFQFGLLLHSIVSPIALGILFYGMFTPMGLAIRVFGKRPLTLNADHNATSYWIRREPPGPAPDSLVNQF